MFIRVKAFDDVSRGRLAAEESVRDDFRLDGP